MTWTLEKMRDVAAQRGEDNKDPLLEKVMAAHERWRGRTEEVYERDVARNDLIGALEKLHGPLPQFGPASYRGLLQLGRYVAEQGLTFQKVQERELAKPLEPSPAVNGQRDMQPDKRNMLEQQAERGVDLHMPSDRDKAQDSAQRDKRRFVRKRDDRDRG